MSPLKEDIAKTIKPGIYTSSVDAKMAAIRIQKIKKALGSTQSLAQIAEDAIIRDVSFWIARAEDLGIQIEI